MKTSIEHRAWGMGKIADLGYEMWDVGCGI